MDQRHCGIVHSFFHQEAICSSEGTSLQHLSKTFKNRVCLTARVFALWRRTPNLARVTIRLYGAEGVCLDRWFLNNHRAHTHTSTKAALTYFCCYKLGTCFAYIRMGSQHRCIMGKKDDALTFHCSAWARWGQWTAHLCSAHRSHQHHRTPEGTHKYPSKLCCMYLSKTHS